MDCKMLTNILEKSKKKLAIENEIFIRAINQRKNDEISFQNSIKRLQKMPDTAIDIFDLHTELGDNKNDDQLKDNKMDVNVLKQNLDKEFNNSRKRLVQMENFAVSIKRSFGIEPSNIVEVYDSPPRTEASEGKGMKIISYEVAPARTPSEVRILKQVANGLHQKEKTESKLVSPPPPKYHRSNQNRH